MQAGISKASILALLLLFLASACSKNQHLNPDISKETLSVKIQRFDKDFYTMDAHKAADVQRVEQAYPHFFTTYNNYVMGFGNPQDSGYVREWTTFLSDTVYSKVYQEVLKLYPNLSPEEQELTLAFRRYHAFFPSDTLPQFFAHVSGFNNPIVYENGQLSVSLDNYLGANHPFYDLIGVYKYQRIRKNRNRIVPDLMLGYLMTKYPITAGQNRLLDQIIYEGKLFFLMHLMAPEIQETTLYAYTPDQLQWCKENSAVMWMFLSEQKHLFSTDRLIRSKYMNEAPNTAWFPSESPGRAVVWLGAQIVSQFMEHNQQVSVPELMQMNDAQLLLKRSKFKP